MGEPFASNLGTASLLKHLEGATSLIGEFNSTSSLDPEAIDLLEQVKDLTAVGSDVDSLVVKERRASSAHLRSFPASDMISFHSVCGSIGTINQECTESLEPLQCSIRDLIRERDNIGYTPPGSELGNQDWYHDIFDTLKIRTEALRVLFSALNLLYRKNDKDEEGNATAEAQSLASTLQYQIAFLKPKLSDELRKNTDALKEAVTVATGVTLSVPTSLNKHFLVGRSAKSFYTGRALEMLKLKEAFEDTSHAGQKKFVIYGLGGSGKTELALKYAEESQQSFWGVFFIDGSSRKNAVGSYSEIAKVGGVEPNEKAAKNWLSTQQLPWLLIIDNVDGDEIDLENLPPAGARGNILITSRNPAHKSYGTVGQRYLELLPMDSGEANELILKAAEEPTPCSASIVKYADTICQALGFLPLALVHAGKAILLGLCSWTGYLKYYERQVERIRRDRLHRRDRSFERNRHRIKEEVDSMNVFSSYEILYHSLEMSQEECFQDAIELLNLFSYLHFQNIRLDVLILAATSPLREARHRENAAKEEEELMRRKLGKHISKSWYQWLRDQLVGVVGYIYPPPLIPALPMALQNTHGLSESAFEGEVHVRLSEALKVLLSRSLIMKQDRLEDRYSMHPLVHRWVRERPQMTISQQALWCQVATTTLSSSIVIPPLGDTEYERHLRMGLLPHINHVRDCQEIIKTRLGENRVMRKSILSAFWSPIDTSFGRLQAVEAARFSRVYSERGLFHEALELQTKVHSFVIRMLGEEHSSSIMITLALSGTLWELSEVAKALKLQRRLHSICVESLGEDHPSSLRVADVLGSSLCFHGRYARAMTLLQRTVEGMTRLYGADHENTLKAMRNLANVHLRYFDFSKAAELHELAWNGMVKRLGETHVDTLISLEDLAMSRMHLGEEHYAESLERMKFVLEERERTLGKEQPYTLLAICNLGRVLARMGRSSEAAKIMKPAVEVAERNLGEDHFGVLAGKMYYAQVLMDLGRLDKAEEMFYKVVDKPQYRKASDEDGEHPDRILALWYLVGCLEKQGKFEEALGICEGLVTSLKEIGGSGLGTRHKFAALLREKMARLRMMMENPPEATDAVTEEMAGKISIW